MRLPVSATAGPRDTRGGLASGFADTPQGALLAAINIGVRTAAQWGSAIFVSTITRQVTGPDTRALLHAEETAYAQLRATAHVRAGQPAGQAHAAEDGYRFAAWSPAAATVEVLTVGSTASGTTVLAATRVQVVWRRGDWRVVAPPGGNWANAATAISSPLGYTIFPGEVTTVHCDTLVEPACALVSRLVTSAASSAASDVLSGLANAISTGVRWTVTNTVAWWISIPSPDLAAEPAITRIQAWLLPITAAVAVGAMIAGGLRMVIARRANPLLDVTGGMLTLAAVTTLGTIVPTLLLKAGDAWSAWVLQASTGGQFAQRLANVLVLGGTAAPAVVLIFGLAAIVLSLVQAALMLFRQAALVILAGVLPLAAAGSLAPLTRPWIRKISSWMLALICYKPAAAAVYAVAFTMIGSGKNPRTVLMGFVMLVLSVLTLPALMKFFTWTTGAVAGSGGGGQLLGAAAVGAIAVGYDALPWRRRRPGAGSGRLPKHEARPAARRRTSRRTGLPRRPAEPADLARHATRPALAIRQQRSTGPRSCQHADRSHTSSPANAPAGSAGTATGAATAAAPAGPAGAAAAAAAAAAQAATAAARRADGAMEPEDTP